MAGVRAASPRAPRSPTGHWPSPRSMPRRELGARADDPAQHGRGQHRLAQPVRVQPELCAEDPNYQGAAGGRTFPSSAGFHTSEIFFTDDSGTYFLPTRDMHPVGTGRRPTSRLGWRSTDLGLELADGRLNIPRQAAHMEMHNTWCSKSEIAEQTRDPRVPATAW